MPIHQFTDSQGIQRRAEIHDNINNVELLQVEKEFEEFDLGRVEPETEPEPETETETEVLGPLGEPATADDLDAPDLPPWKSETLNTGI